MQPLGTKVYLLKRYSPSDSFCTFFSDSARTITIKITITITIVLASTPMNDSALFIFSLSTLKLELFKAE